MKLYNPFKPHIVTDGEKYAIRRLKSCVLWQYFDLQNLNYWWIRDYDRKYCWTRSLDQAKAFLQTANDYSENQVRKKERPLKEKEFYDLD